MCYEDKTGILGYCFSFLKPFALGKAKIVYNFGLSECNRVNENLSCDPSVERSRWDSSTGGGGGGGGNNMFMQVNVEKYP